MKKTCLLLAIFFLNNVFTMDEELQNEELQNGEFQNENFFKEPEWSDLTGEQIRYFINLEKNFKDYEDIQYKKGQYNQFEKTIQCEGQAWSTVTKQQAQEEETDFEGGPDEESYFGDGLEGYDQYLEKYDENVQAQEEQNNQEEIPDYNNGEKNKKPIRYVKKRKKSISSKNFVEGLQNNQNQLQLHKIENNLECPCCEKNIKWKVIAEEKKVKVKTLRNHLEHNHKQKYGEMGSMLKTLRNMLNNQLLNDNCFISLEETIQFLEKVFTDNKVFLQQGGMEEEENFSNKIFLQQGDMKASENFEISPYNDKDQQNSLVNRNTFLYKKNDDNHFQNLQSKEKIRKSKKNQKKYDTVVNKDCKIFICPFCSQKNIAKISTINSHFRTKHEINVYSCLTSNEEFFTKTDSGCPNDWYINNEKNVKKLEEIIFDKLKESFLEK
jgi:hypothetical protein